MSPNVVLTKKSSSNVNLSASNYKLSLYTSTHSTYPSIMSSAIRKTQSRKRKQSIGNSSSFLVPSIPPAKRASLISINVPKMKPSHNSVELSITENKSIETESKASFSSLTSDFQYASEKEKLIKMIQ